MTWKIILRFDSNNKNNELFENQTPTKPIKKQKHKITYEQCKNKEKSKQICWTKINKLLRKCIFGYSTELRWQIRAKLISRYNAKHFANFVHSHDHQLLRRNSSCNTIHVHNITNSYRLPNIRGRFIKLY